MNHADVDPSLRPSEPLLDSLEDGFSPPAADPGPLPQQRPTAAEPPSLGAKSAF